MIAIITCFQYDIDYYIPGIIRDLYTMYKFCTRNKFPKILVITDIDDVDSKYLRELINKEYVEEDVYQFLDTIKNNGCYYRYKDRENFEKVLSKNMNNDKILFYYSGHSEYNHFILPDKSVFNTKEITKMLNRDCEAMLIFDCCNCSNLGLPFMMCNGKYKLVGKEFIKGKVILLASTLEGENSYSDKYGSLFTDSLLKCLHGYPSINKVVKLMGYKNTNINVFSSYPNLHNVWNWILGKKLVVDIDMYNCLIKVKHDVLLST